MPKTIISKKCIKCNTIKALSEFHKDCTVKDNHNRICKVCKSEYQKAYYRTEYGRAKIRKNSYFYSKTENYKTYRKAWRQTKEGKVAKAGCARRYNLRYPERGKASKAIGRAVKKGLLPHISTLQCSKCPNQAEQYHHWSYLPEHWLDVIPTCDSCHKIHFRFQSR